MKQYLDVVKHVLDNGTRKENRTGVDTLSCFNLNYTIDLNNGFPLMTTKSVSWKNIVVEMLWFLSGSTDIKLLWKHGCKFWDAWADPVTGEVPSAYGNFWRRFPVPTFGHKDSASLFPNMQSVGVEYNDQIKYVIDQLKTNPMSRRMVVSAWAPGNAQTSALPPCHSVFMVNVQKIHGEILDEPGWHGSTAWPIVYNQICLHLTQRSADIALGVPYNIASYALLIRLLSRFSGIGVGSFGHTLVDAHIYTSKHDGSMAEYDHVPGLREQLTRTPKRLPKLTISEDIKSLEDVEALLKEDTATIMSKFVIDGYDPYPAIKFKVAV